MKIMVTILILSASMLIPTSYTLFDIVGRRPNLRERHDVGGECACRRISLCKTDAYAEEEGM
jgi:hypothetical protein